MNIILFYESDKIDGTPDTYFFTKNDERYRHCKKVLRLKSGDKFKAGRINADSGIAEILRFDDEALSFKFFPGEKAERSFPIDLLLGFPRPIQLKRCLKDTATLGIRQIHLVPTDLGEASYLKSNLVQDEEIQKFLIEGASQAATTILPKVRVYTNLDTFFALTDFSKDTLKIVFDIHENATPLYSFLQNIQKNIKSKSSHSIILAIGNERGWTDKERSLFKDKNFHICSLGKRILKTETAVTTSCAIVLSVLGFWD